MALQPTSVSTEQCPILWTRHTLFIPRLLEGARFGCFQVLAIFCKHLWKGFCVEVRVLPLLPRVSPQRVVSMGMVCKELARDLAKQILFSTFPAAERQFPRPHTLSASNDGSTIEPHHSRVGAAAPHSQSNCSKGLGKLC